MRVPSTNPGAIQLTVTSGASATARQRVRWINPALLAEYAMLLLAGYSPPTEAMFTILPAPCARRYGAKALASKYGPRRFVSRTRSQISAVRALRAVNGIPMFHPALLA